MEGVDVVFDDLNKFGLGASRRKAFWTGPSSRLVDELNRDGFCTILNVSDKLAGNVSRRHYRKIGFQGRVMLLGDLCERKG